MGKIPNRVYIPIEMTENHPRNFAEQLKGLGFTVICFHADKPVKWDITLHNIKIMLKLLFMCVIFSVTYILAFEEKVGNSQMLLIEHYLY